MDKTVYIDTNDILHIVIVEWDETHLETTSNMKIVGRYCIWDGNGVEWYTDDWEGSMYKEYCGFETLVFRKDKLSFESLNISNDSKGTKYCQRREDL